MAGIMYLAVLAVTFLFSVADSNPLQDLVNGEKLIISQEVSIEDKGDDQCKELVQVLETKVLSQKVDDNTGKILPEEVAKNVIPGVVKVPQSPGRDKQWGRKMNEAQWHQHQSHLNPKPFPEYKKVMHNRNTINDNRHDRKAMKIPRNPQ